MADGIKSLAIKNINEFLYGVRAERTRKNAMGQDEPEPLLYFFWQVCACAHAISMHVGFSYAPAHTAYTSA